MFLLQVCFMFFCVLDAFESAKMYHYRHKAPRIMHQRSARIKWSTYTAKVDNFNPNNTETFKLRYNFNEENCKYQNCPLVIYIGGEWEISEGWMEEGQLFEIARENGGSLFYIEHRYYGKSIFTKDFTTKSLDKLHSRQALADIKGLIDMLHGVNGYEKSPVVLFGCSYSAALTAWMKQMYPDDIAVTYSTSGPFHAKDKYMEVITKDIASKDSECAEILKEGIAQLENEYDSDGQNGNTVRQKLGYCDETEPDKYDKAALFQTFAVNWGNMGQDDPEQLAIECKKLNDSVGATYVEKLVSYHTGGSSSKSCTVNNYKIYLSIYLDTSLKGDDRLWLYQQCNEFGWFETTDSENQSFGHSVLPFFYHRICRDAFTSEFSDQVLIDKQKATYKFYNGTTPSVRKAIFVYGTFDPWAPMGIQKNLNDEAIRFQIEGGDHCEDMFPESDSDNESMKNVKRETRAQIKKWLDELE